MVIKAYFAQSADARICQAPHQRALHAHIPHLGVVGMHTHSDTQMRNGVRTRAQDGFLKNALSILLPRFQIVEGGVAVFSRIAHSTHETHVMVCAFSQFSSWILEHFQMCVRVGNQAWQNRCSYFTVLVVLTFLKKGNAERPLFNKSSAFSDCVSSVMITAVSCYSMERSMASASKRG